ncbi:MAG: hypothetical protein U5K72_18385 [Balneolaceae bacterium]|nr:hypothetical protein [Balneolaceae bacterium]
MKDQENNVNSAYNISFTDENSWTWTNTIEYQLSFSDVHDLDLLVGTEAYKESQWLQGASVQDFFTLDPDFISLSTGTGRRSTSSTELENTLLSGFSKRNTGMMTSIYLIFL